MEEFNKNFFSILAKLIKLDFSIRKAKDLKELGYKLETEENFEEFSYCITFSNENFYVLCMLLDLPENDYEQIVNKICNFSTDKCEKDIFIIGLLRNLEKHELFKFEPSFKNIMYNFIAGEFIDFANLEKKYFDYLSLKERIINGNLKDTNIIDISKFIKSEEENIKLADEILNILRNLRKHYQKIKSIGSFRKKFYEIFINPYLGQNNELLSNDSLSMIYENYIKLIGEEETIYKKTHFKPKEIFRLPTPFFLQDFIQTFERFNQFMKNMNKKISLLLIDNKPREKMGKVFEILKNYHLDRYFLIHALYEEDGKIEASKILLEKEKNLDLSNKNKIYNVLNKIFSEDLNYHFILMDFFLHKKENKVNEVDLIIASEFLESMDKYKRENYIFLKDWVFMVSDYSESFIKYLQGGVVSETFNSIFVNFGESSHQKKSIVFVYKLLKFILNRLQHFQNLHSRIVNTFLADSQNNDDKIDKYVYVLDELIKETYAIGNIFFEKKENGIRFYTSLKNLVETYLYISPVDWPVLERQIDYMNHLINELKHEEKSLNEIKGFSNQKILKDLEKWKEEY